MRGDGPPRRGIPRGGADAASPELRPAATGRARSFTLARCKRASPPATATQGWTVSTLVTLYELTQATSGPKRRLAAWLRSQGAEDAASSVAGSPGKIES